MCTVTFIPVNNTDFILTSSRDVPFSRKKALKPKTYLENNIQITYPKDGKAGGTWIGHSEKKRLICLLNGGFTNHITKSDYVKSRGIIVRNLLMETNIDSALSKINLQNIEPFTLVIVDWNTNLRLLEFVWDGIKKHFTKLPQKMHIWSSATLYDEEMKKMRVDWFTEWQNSLCPKHIEDNEFFDFYLWRILNFHKNAGIGKPEVDILMKREKVGTVSITQVFKKNKNVRMKYLDINTVD